MAEDTRTPRGVLGGLTKLVMRFGMDTKDEDARKRVSEYVTRYKGEIYFGDLKQNAIDTLNIYYDLKRRVNERKS